MPTTPKETVKAVCAAIFDDEGRFFAAKRDYGFLKGYFEFPGGKIEMGETSFQAIEREIEEELSTAVKAIRSLGKVEYDYPDFRLDMEVIECKVESGRLSLHKHIHSEERFFRLEEADKALFCPADCLVIDLLGSK